MRLPVYIVEEATMMAMFDYSFVMGSYNVGHKLHGYQCYIDQVGLRFLVAFYWGGVIPLQNKIAHPSNLFPNKIQ
jgi:hypothetical protein